MKHDSPMKRLLTIAGLALAPVGAYAILLEMPVEPPTHFGGHFSGKLESVTEVGPSTSSGIGSPPRIGTTEATPAPAEGTGRAEQPGATAKRARHVLAQTAPIAAASLAFIGPSPSALGMQGGGQIPGSRAPVHQEDSDEHSEDTSTHSEVSDTHSPNTDTHFVSTSVHSKVTDTHDPNSDTHTFNTDKHLQNTDTHYNNTDTHTDNTDKHTSNTNTHFNNTDDHQNNTDTHTTNSDKHTNNTDTHLQSTDDHDSHSTTHIVGTDVHNSHSKTHSTSTDNHYEGSDTHTTNSDMHTNGSDTHTSSSKTHSSGSDDHYTSSDSHVNTTDTHYDSSDHHDVWVSLGHGPSSASHGPGSGSHDGISSTHNSISTTHNGSSGEGTTGGGTGGTGPCENCTGGCSPNTGESEVNGQAIQTLVVCVGGHADFNLLHRIVTHNTGRPRDLHGTLKFQLVDGDSSAVQLRDGASVVAIGAPVDVIETGHSGCGLHDWHSGTKVITVDGLQPGKVELEAVVDPNPETPEGDGDPTLKARVTIHVVKVEMKSIDFITDHNLLQDEANDWIGEGSPFFGPEWKDDGTNNPISQTKDSFLGANFSFKVTPTDAPPFGITLNGDGTTSAFSFHKQTTLAGGTTNLQIYANDKLPNHVGIENHQVTWTYQVSANGSTADCTLPNTGPHKVFVTLLGPTALAVDGRSNMPTVKRMEGVCTWADGATNPTQVAHKISDKFIEPDLPELDPYNVLGPVSYWTAMATGAWQCKDLAYLMQCACGQLGVTGEVGFCYGTTDTQNYSTSPTATENRFHQPVVINNQTYYFDEFLGFAGNAYEATFLVQGVYYAVDVYEKPSSMLIVEGFVCPNVVGDSHQAWTYVAHGHWFEDDQNPPFPVPWPNACPP